MQCHRLTVLAITKAMGPMHALLECRGLNAQGASLLTQLGPQECATIAREKYTLIGIRSILMLNLTHNHGDHQIFNPLNRYIKISKNLFHNNRKLNVFGERCENFGCVQPSNALSLWQTNADRHSKRTRAEF